MNYPHGIGHVTSTELDTAKVGQRNPIQSKNCALRNEFAAENGVGNIVDRRFYPKVFEGIRFGLCRNMSRIKETEDTKQQLYLF